MLSTSRLQIQKHKQVESKRLKRYLTQTVAKIERGGYTCSRQNRPEVKKVTVGQSTIPTRHGCRSDPQSGAYEQQPMNAEVSGTTN